LQATYVFVRVFHSEIWQTLLNEISFGPQRKLFEPGMKDVEMNTGYNNIFRTQTKPNRTFGIQRDREGIARSIQRQTSGESSSHRA
jgi:hypothetical protein